MGTGDRFARARLTLGRALWLLRPRSLEPLVSIVIPTWNRAELLATRTLPSILRQTYRNWEAIVVGDACTDDTALRIAALGDPRIRFHNLAERGAYPEDPLQRWMVAGSTPANEGLEFARGDWLGYLDDDDLFTEDHIEVLLRFARESNAEFVFGSGDFQRSPAEWLRIGRLPPSAGNVMHSGVLYRSYLRFLKYDLAAWKASIGADAHLWGRMHGLGVRFAFLDRVVCRAPLRPGETLAGQRAAERRAAQTRTPRPLTREADVARPFAELGDSVSPAASPEFRDAESLLEAKLQVVAEHGPWTTPIDLGFGVNTCDAAGADPTGGTRLLRILQVVEDVAGGDSRGVKILDLGCLEGMVSAAFARRGAAVLGIEARESNLARACFAKRALNLGNLELVRDDVRNLSREEYGSFKIVLCLGILYHLPAPDLFKFVDRVFQVTERAVVIDTHVAMPEATRDLLGPLESLEYKGRSYRGRPYREFEPNSRSEDRLKCVWSSLDERPSFWPTSESLFKLLETTGFTSVLEVRTPSWRGMPDDRILLIAFKGSNVSPSSVSGGSVEPFPDE